MVMLEWPPGIGLSAYRLALVNRYGWNLFESPAFQRRLVRAEPRCTSDLHSPPNNIEMVNYLTNIL
jgi:hypothetical protein